MLYTKERLFMVRVVVIDLITNMNDLTSKFIRNGRRWKNLIQACRRKKKKVAIATKNSEQKHLVDRPTFADESSPVGALFFLRLRHDSCVAGGFIMQCTAIKLY